jgi:hypothetical protein
MASTSSLRRYRRGFLVASLIGFGLALAFAAFEYTRPASHAVLPPQSATPVRPAPVEAEPRDPHHHSRAPNEAVPKQDLPIAPESPAPEATGWLSADLPLLSACASLSAALIALLGFVITSVMTLRKERRESALFAVELEMKRMQLETMRSGQHTT